LLFEGLRIMGRPARQAVGLRLTATWKRTPAQNARWRIRQEPAIDSAGVRACHPLPGQVAGGEQGGRRIAFVRRSWSLCRDPARRTPCGIWIFMAKRE